MIEFYTQIKKRDGRIVDFDASKISTAITKAAESVAKLAPSDVLTIDHLTDTVTAKIRDRYHDDVEIAEIQTVVEQTLIAAEKYNWAEAYTEYRLKRDLARKQKQDVNYNVCLLYTSPSPRD